MRALYVERRPLVAALLAERPCCEAGIPGLCTGRSTDVHELLSRARGGSILQPDGLLCLCRSCHEHVTDEPSWAEARAGAVYRAGGAGGHGLPRHGVRDRPPLAVEDEGR